MRLVGAERNEVDLPWLMASPRAGVLAQHKADSNAILVT
jgi:hypothetical protein